MHQLIAVLTAVLLVVTAVSVKIRDSGAPPPVVSVVSTSTAPSVAPATGVLKAAPRRGKSAAVSVAPATTTQTTTSQNAATSSTPFTVSYVEPLLATSTSTPTTTVSAAPVAAGGGGGGGSSALSPAPEPPLVVVSEPPRIPWSVGVLVLDGVDATGKVEQPLQEAIAFVERFSRFRVSYSVHMSSLPHGYTYYSCDRDPQGCVVTNYSDVDSGVIASLPTADSYAFFWNASGSTPLHAGSAWWVTEGIPKDGIKRPYATIPTDPWWYNNQPFEGLNQRSAQIIAHELINTISFKLEVAPYLCISLTGTPGDPAEKYESDRLKKLTDECYEKLQ